MADLGKANGAITINIGVDIANETVELCLSVIEYWLNRHPDKRIVGGIRDEDGRVGKLRIENRIMPRNDCSFNESGDSNADN